MSKIRKSARGKACQVRLPGICNFDPETTVLAHLNGYGMGGKHHDFLGAYCCSSCHAVIDGHQSSCLDAETIKVYHYEGIFRTQQFLYNQKLIETKGSK